MSKRGSRRRHRSTSFKTDNRQVSLLYSQSIHRWEAWFQGRPVAESTSLDILLTAFPHHLEVTKYQCKMADDDRSLR